MKAEWNHKKCKPHVETYEIWSVAICCFEKKAAKYRRDQPMAHEVDQMIQRHEGVCLQ